MTETILLLTADQFRIIGTVSAHVDAFKAHSRYRVVQLDTLAANEMELDLTDFAAIVVHYSVIVSNGAYFPESLARKFARFTGPKILFVQDEMRWVNRTEQTILDLGFTVVFSVVSPEVQAKLYPRALAAGVRIESTLTGFVDESLNRHDVPAYRDRKWDVVYRARKLSAFYGAFAQEKWQIGDRFARDATRSGLRHDISSREGDRIYGQAWLDFLGNSRATLGVESGSSFVDFDGSVLPQIEQYERANPGATFEELRDRFLEGRDGEIVISAISPRCFEAASLRTLMIMYEGFYSGVLEPWRHYAVLKRDHSNMDEIVALIRNPDRALEIIDAAYRDVACSERWTYAAFIRRFDHVVAELLLSRRSTETASAMSDSRISELETLSRHLCRRRVRRMQLATFLAETLSRTDAVAAKVLPRFVYDRVRAIARRAFSYIRPALRSMAGLG